MTTVIKGDGEVVPSRLTYHTSTPWCVDLRARWAEFYPHLPMRDNVVFVGPAVLALAFNKKSPHVTAVLLGVDNDEHSTAADFLAEVALRSGFDPRFIEITSLGSHVPARVAYAAVCFRNRYVDSLADFYKPQDGYAAIPSDALIFKNGTIVSNRTGCEIIMHQRQTFDLSMKHCRCAFDEFQDGVMLLLIARRSLDIEYHVDVTTLLQLLRNCMDSCTQFHRECHSTLPTYGSWAHLLERHSWESTPTIRPARAALGRLLSLLANCGLLDMEWSNLFLAGGSVLYCLDSMSDNWLGENQMDLYFFIHRVQNAAMALDVLCRIVHFVHRQRPDVQLLVSAEAITITGAHPSHDIHILLRWYESRCDALSYFNIPCERLGFDGETFYFSTHGAHRTLATRVIPCQLIDGLTRSKQIEYVKKGFDFVHICVTTGALYCTSPLLPIPFLNPLGCGCSGFVEYADDGHETIVYSGDKDISILLNEVKIVAFPRVSLMDTYQY